MKFNKWLIGVLACLVTVAAQAVYFNNLNPAEPLGWGDGKASLFYNNSTGALTIRTGSSDTTRMTISSTGTVTIPGALVASGGVTGTTFTGLAANGANCSAGSFPLGVDASGAAESCTALSASNAGTATALAADPADCSANQYATSIAASGALTCSAVTNTQVSGLLEAYVASNQTNATATPASTTLSVTVASSGHYRGRMVLYVADSQAAEGVLADFDGGAATMTDFRAHCTILDTALIKTVQTSAIATDVAIATATGDSVIECDMGFTVNAGGTFIPRFAQNSHSSGTATLYKNSFLALVKNG